MVNSSLLVVPIQQLPGNEDLPLPVYGTRQAAAMDLHAAVVEPVAIAPGTVVVVPCGFALAVPEGFEAQIRPRSGLAARHGLTVLNTPGTIDADYRGEVKVVLINHGTEPFVVTRGTRIAQMLLVPVPRVEWAPAASLPPTGRGEGGFGHTGQ